MIKTINNQKLVSISHSQQKLAKLSYAWPAAWLLPTSEVCIHQVTKLLSELPAALIDKIGAALDANQIQLAFDTSEELLRLYPDESFAHNLRGKSLQRLKRFDEAIESFGKALQIDPGLVDAKLNLANTLAITGNPTDAIPLFHEVLQQSPTNIKATFNFGALMQNIGNQDAALGLYDKVLGIDPSHVGALNNKSNILKTQGDLHAAITCLQKAFVTSPTPDIAYNYGNLLHQAGRYDEALSAYDAAITAKADHAHAHNNRGVLLLSKQNYREAGAAFERAIRAQPGYADAYNNLGNCLRKLRRDQEALACYQEAIKYRQDYPEAHNNIGMLLSDQGKPREALLHFDRALSLNPEFSEAYYNRGSLHLDEKRLTLAISDLQRATKLNPNYLNAYATLLHTRMHACDWEGIENDFKKLDQLIADGAPVNPFIVLPTPSSAVIQKQCSQNHVLHKLAKGSHHLAMLPLPHTHERIKLGYFSADFHNHATTYLIAELFEKHDKSQFELIAFSFGPQVEDEMRNRIRMAFDQFHDVRNQTDQQITELSRQLEIDIAIDLKGYTKEARPGIFANRAAPIQVNYLGYPGTMGADFIDYLIADPVLIPDADRMHYSEKIIQMPNSYQINDRQRKVSNHPQTKADHGLPENAFVFCCFNNNFKITPDVFASWMRILREVKNSVLWLFEANLEATLNLRNHAQNSGVAAERIIFASKKSLPDHLARYRLADLVLDTFHYNAHTTTSDALWVGCPVITRLGATFAGRVAASLLTAHGLPELITTSTSGYEALAIDLARHPDRLTSIRNKTQQHRADFPLFDSGLFTKHFEHGLRWMMQRHRANLPPEHYPIPATVE